MLNTFIYIAETLVKGTDLPRVAANQNKLQSILNIVFGVAGALAFLMVVIGGFRYVISGGDPNKVSSSKSTILFAAVGLIVVASAAIIVNFVLNRV